MVSSSLLSSRISSCMPSPARLPCTFRISVSVSGRLSSSLRQSSFETAKGSRLGGAGCSETFYRRGRE